MFSHNRRNLEGFSSNQRNPYIIGRPITESELFFGRDTLFQFIADNLVQGAQVILLHGQRRIGKSSVLAQIPNFVDLEGFEFVPLSLEGDSQKPLAEVLHELARDSLEHFDLMGQVELPSIALLKHKPKLFADRFLPDLRKALKTQNLVLLLDEFDALADYDSEAAPGHLFPYLQAAVYEHKELFIIPVVGRQLHELPRLLGLFREAPNQEVGFLDNRSAEQLITQPARGVLEYTPDTIAAILELSAGHPYFTQLICFALFAQAREENRWKITRADVQRVVDNGEGTGRGRAIELGEGGITWFWDGLPLPERVVFSAAAEIPELKLAKIGEAATLRDEYLALQFTEAEPLELLVDCGVMLTETLRQAELNLFEWKFLQPVPMRTSRSGTSIPPRMAAYRVTIELVRRWLVRKHSIRREIWQLEHLNAEAHHLYETVKALRQTATTVNVLSGLSRVLNLNPNHFGALFELAESLTELRQFSQALKHYDRAYQVDPIRAKDGYLLALHNYGEELREEGHLEDAIDVLEKALEIDPDNEEIEELLEKVHKEQQYSEYLTPISFNVGTNGNGKHLSSKEPTSEEDDLVKLQQEFRQLWDQVSGEAPREVKDQALERLSEVGELFTTKKLNLATLAYVKQWFLKRLPPSLASAVSRFVEEVVDTAIEKKDVDD
ncbi:tetratricopeptide repeat protein [Phormidesmis sp. 146-35]